MTEEQRLKGREYCREYYRKNRDKFRLARSQPGYRQRQADQSRKRRRENPLIVIYRAMLARCYYPSHKDYYYYGGRGIEVCHEWRKSFASFRQWCQANGYRKGICIDRRDVDGDYCPENCRFIDRRESSRNRRNVTITVEKASEIRRLLMEGMTARQLCEMFKVGRHVIYKIKKGITWAT